MLDSSTLIIEEKGIKILCTNRKATKPDFHHYDALKYENLNLVDDTATINGFIEDYDTTVFSSEGKISYQSALTGVEEEDATIPFTIHPDGRFQVEFSGIINRFKDNVIYIDFWADWCSPCRAEFPYAEVLKKEYEGKNIVFLYLGMSCEYENWTNMIKQKQIKGYHYWLNKEQGKLLSEKFQIKGIPHFLLVDRKSNVLNEEASRPSSKMEIREQIDRLLSY